MDILELFGCQVTVTRTLRYPTADPDAASALVTSLIVTVRVKRGKPVTGDSVGKFAVVNAVYPESFR